jgi:hypothetical protein
MGEALRIGMDRDASSSFLGYEVDALVAMRVQVEQGRAKGRSRRYWVVEQELVDLELHRSL